MWEGTNPGLGRTILNAFIGTVLKSIQQKDTWSIVLGPNVLTLGKILIFTQ